MDGSEFQVCETATEKDRRANSVRVLETFSMAAGRRMTAEDELEQLSGSVKAKVKN